MNLFPVEFRETDKYSEVGIIRFQFAPHRKSVISKGRTQRRDVPEKGEDIRVGETRFHLLYPFG